MADSSSLAMPKVITFLSSLLQRVSESNDLMNHQYYPQKISVFHGLTRPSISIQSYLERIFKYANCSPSCFVVAYVYLDRFARRHPSFPIDSFNVHRLLITSVLLSVKFMDDMSRPFCVKILPVFPLMMKVMITELPFKRFTAQKVSLAAIGETADNLINHCGTLLSICIYYNNAYYAKVGGISTAEINVLELDFLFSLGFQLNVTPSTFHTYCSYLQREMLMHSSPLQIVEPPLRTLTVHCCFNEDESTHQRRLAV